MHVQLCRESRLVNHKKIDRIYRLEGLNLLRNKPSRHVIAAWRQQRPVLTMSVSSEVWILCRITYLTGGVFER
ncbi:hypothetical protein H2241_22570 [Pantoea ananatis]|nr:hypothetical protein [Pantoea ananatis]QKV86120.1 hypothetical protein FOB88_01805 [Pantoea ananatis]